jgi:hypothetical protein
VDVLPEHGPIAFVMPSERGISWQHHAGERVVFRCLYNLCSHRIVGNVSGRVLKFLRSSFGIAQDVSVGVLLPLDSQFGPQRMAAAMPLEVSDEQPLVRLETGADDEQMRVIGHDAVHGAGSVVPDQGVEENFSEMHVPVCIEPAFASVFDAESPMRGRELLIRVGMEFGEAILVE